VIFRSPNRVTLVCAFTVSVIFAGTAWSETSQTANADYGCTYSPKAKDDVLRFEHCAWSDAAGQIHLKRKHQLALDFDRHGWRWLVLCATGWAAGPRYDDGELGRTVRRRPRKVSSRRQDRLHQP
jgi:hypothetical protein